MLMDRVRSTIILVGEEHQQGWRRETRYEQRIKPTRDRTFWCRKVSTGGRLSATERKVTNKTVQRVGNPLYQQFSNVQVVQQQAQQAGPLQENPLMRFADRAVSWDEWVKANQGLTYDEIVNQMPARNGFAGGPRLRYVFDPVNPKAVVDMRHVLIVGKMGPAFGNANELLQLKTDPSSAMDPKDFYSNRLGYRFYNYVEGKGLTGWIVNNIISSPENFVNRLNGFMTNPVYRGPIFIDR